MLLECYKYQKCDFITYRLTYPLFHKLLNFNGCLLSNISKISYNHFQNVGWAGFPSERLVYKDTRKQIISFIILLSLDQCQLSILYGHHNKVDERKLL